MTSDDRNPPRLRSLQHELPAELSRALESSSDEEAKPAELEALRASIARFRASERVHAVRLESRRRPAIFRRSVALAMTLAIGAGAGVVVTKEKLFESRDSSPPPPAPSAIEKSPVTEATPVRKAPLSAVAPPPSSVPEAAPPEAATPVSPRPPTSATVRRPISPLAHGDELALLARAQAALATNPGAALELVATHARAFRGGTLAQEREVIAIDALSRLGRKAEATARARRFHRLFPASAHGRRVEVIVGVPVSAGENHN
jgi:hypothetical protein